MANDLALKTDTPIACETLFSTTSLQAAIPAWLDRDLLEPNSIFSLPAKLPDGACRELRAAADRFGRSLEIASTHEERTAVLGELRLLTKTRNENVEEARARFRLLREKLDSVPADILREAVDAYARSNRFFPDGPAEILPFVERIRHARSRAAFTLKRLAKEAEERQAHERRLAEDPLTAEAAAAIIEEFGLKPETAEIIRPSGPRRKPTVEDYVAMGVDRAAAEQSVRGPSEAQSQ